MAAEGAPPAKKAKMTKTDLEALSKEELIEKWQEREELLESLMAKQSSALTETGADAEKVKQKEIDHTRRENVLMMRLTTKEQEVQEYMNQVGELKQAQNTSTAQLRSMLLDPAINLMFQRMKKEMDACKEKLEQAQNDLAAWKFTPDSQTGKRLMAKCRMLLQENEELGKVISSGRTAKLEGEIALEKTLVAEMKKSQSEMDEFLMELEEDVEGMQSTIYFLQQQLKEAKEQNIRLTAELEQLKAEKAAQQQNETDIHNINEEHDDKRTTNSELAGDDTGTQKGEGELRTRKSTSPKRKTPSPTPSTSPTRSPKQPVSKQNSVKQSSPTNADVTDSTSTLQTSSSHTHSSDDIGVGSNENNNKSDHKISQSQTTSNGGDKTGIDNKNGSSNSNEAVTSNNTETEFLDGGPPPSVDQKGPEPAPKTRNYPTRGKKGQKNGISNTVRRTRRTTKSTEQKLGENTDANSSEGWSPSASKHSGSHGAAEEDASSTVSDADQSNDHKSGQAIQNGLTSEPVSSQYNSQGEEEEMET